MEGHGGRPWWPPAHPWAERYREVARIGWRYPWKIAPALGLTLGAAAASVGGATRGEVVPTAVGALAFVAMVVGIVLYLDQRLERRARSGIPMRSEWLDDVRGEHRLEPIDFEDLPVWLQGVRALHRRADGLPIHPVAVLARGHELVVALVTIDASVEAGEVVVVSRLPVDVASFRLWPRWRFGLDADRGLRDLYKVQPDPTVVPAGLADWLVRVRPRIDLDVTGHWCAVTSRSEPNRDLLEPPPTAARVADDVDDLIVLSARVAELVVA